MKIFLKQNFIFIVIVCIYLFAVSFLLKFGQPIPYDDNYLLPPIENLHSLKDYFAKIAKNEIWDIQPVRDLTYFIDYKLINLLGFWKFHFTNFIIWILSSILVRKFLYESLNFFQILNENSKKWATYFSLFFLCHPVMQLGPFWISSRKHLLALFFTVWAGWYFLKVFNLKKISTTSSITIITLYALAIFSHPIVILFPFFIIAILLLKLSPKKILTLAFQKEYFTLFIGLFLFAALNGYANYIFYFIKFDKMSGGLPVQITVENISQLRAITFGRFFYQFFDITSASPLDHDRGSFVNIIGLLVFPIFIYIFSKIVNYKKIIFAMTWYFFPLAIVIFGDVKLFAMDTYLIIAAIGMISLLLFAIAEVKFRYAVYFLLFPMLYLSAEYSKAFKSLRTITYYAIKKEFSLTSQIIYGPVLFEEGRFDEAFAESYALSRINPNAEGLDYLLPASLFYSKKISSHKKIQIFEKWNAQSPYYFFYFSQILGQSHSKFNSLILNAINNLDKLSIKNEMLNINIQIVAMLNKSCPKELKVRCLRAIENYRTSNIKMWDDWKYLEANLAFTKFYPSACYPEDIRSQILENSLMPNINYTWKFKKPTKSNY